MKQFSASHTTSRNSSLPHNRREEKYTGKNVDRNGIHEQWLRVEIEDLYEELFSDAIEKYNAKQKRNDRKIFGGAREYLERIRNEWEEYYQRGIVENGKLVRHFNDYEDALKHLNYNKGRNPRSAYYESIVQIGNHEHQPDEQTCKAILREYVDTFQERNPNLKLMEVHYHADEKTPHIHLDFVPVAYGYKQGLEVQNGFDKALMQQMGLERSGTKFKTPSLAWYEQEQKVLSEIALSYGIEISSEKVLEPGRKEHESVKAYKERMRGKQELDDREKRLEARETTLNEKEGNLSTKEKRLTEAKSELLKVTEGNDKRERNLNEREKLLEARESTLEKRDINVFTREQKLSESEYELQRRHGRISTKKQELDKREQNLVTKEEKARQLLKSMEADYIHMQTHYERLKEKSEELYNAMTDDIDNYTLDWMRRTKTDNGLTIWERYKRMAQADMERTMKPKPRTREASEPQIYDAVGRYSSSNYVSKPVSKDNGLER